MTLMDEHAKLAKHIQNDLESGKTVDHGAIWRLTHTILECSSALATVNQTNADLLKKCSALVDQLNQVSSERDAALQGKPLPTYIASNLYQQVFGDHGKRAFYVAECLNERGVLCALGLGTASVIDSNGNHWVEFGDKHHEHNTSNAKYTTMTITEIAVEIERFACEMAVKKAAGNSDVCTVGAVAPTIEQILANFYNDSNAKRFAAWRCNAAHLRTWLVHFWLPKYSKLVERSVLERVRDRLMKLNGDVVTDYHWFMKNSVLRAIDDELKAVSSGQLPPLPIAEWTESDGVWEAKIGDVVLTVCRDITLTKHLFLAFAKYDGVDVGTGRLPDIETAKEVAARLAIQHFGAHIALHSA